MTMRASGLSLRARIGLQLANWAQRVAGTAVIKRVSGLSGVDDSRGGWWSVFSGFRHAQFQTDGLVAGTDAVLRQPTVFSCMTQIASDIGKLRAKLVQLSAAGIWEEVVNAAFSPVLRKPNHYQTWQKFIETWIFSLLTSGNTYVLKVRDRRRVVVALFVLDPTRCRPLVSQSGAVFYQLQEDDLSGVFEALPAVPADEIIHDRINCLFHPLVGISPLFAAALTATKGLRAEENATRFFQNQSQPGGVLTAPAEIKDETAKRLKAYFEEAFTGENAGKVAVLGDGLTWEAMGVKPVDAQLVDQLKWSAEQVCAIFHVPAYMVGAASVPAGVTIEALRRDYYDRCLQTLIEGIENILNEGLGLGVPVGGRQLGVELDLDGLLRMDTTALTAALKEQTGAGILKIDEARKRLGHGPIEGGDTAYLQQQNYSLAALARRDAAEDPFATAPAPAPTPAPGEDEEDEEESQEEAKAARRMRAFAAIAIARKALH